ncbi:MAG: CsgG/HfaB family protein [Desulfomonilia bacterium]
MRVPQAIHLSVACLIMLYSGCATVQEHPAAQTVAVWDLEDLSINPGAYPDMGQMLSSQVMETIRQGGSHEVVERQRLLLILEELNLGSSELADETTRLRIGKLAGAGKMVFGGYQVIGQSMRIDLRLVDVSTGRIIKASEKTTSSTDLRGWMNAAQQAARDLL